MSAAFVPSSSRILVTLPLSSPSVCRVAPLLTPARRYAAVSMNAQETPKPEHAETKQMQKTQPATATAVQPQMRRQRSFIDRFFNDPFFEDQFRLFDALMPQALLRPTAAFPEISPQLAEVERKTQSIIPRWDITETDKQMKVKVEMPGVTGKDVKVDVRGDTLFISGERKSEVKEEDKEHQWIRKEIMHGSFERAMRLPKNVEKKGIKAVVKDGILTVTMPKMELEKPADTWTVPVAHGEAEHHEEKK